MERYFHIHSEALLWINNMITNKLKIRLWGFSKQIGIEDILGEILASLSENTVDIRVS